MSSSDSEKETILTAPDIIKTANDRHYPINIKTYEIYYRQFKGWCDIKFVKNITAYL